MHFLAVSYRLDVFFLLSFFIPFSRFSILLYSLKIWSSVKAGSIWTSSFSFYQYRLQIVISMKLSIHNSFVHLSVRPSFDPFIPPSFPPSLPPSLLSLFLLPSLHPSLPPYSLSFSALPSIRPNDPTVLTSESAPSVARLFLWFRSKKSMVVLVRRKKQNLEQYCTLLCKPILKPTQPNAVAI